MKFSWQSHFRYVAMISCITCATYASCTEQVLQSASQVADVQASSAKSSSTKASQVKTNQAQANQAPAKIALANIDCTDYLIAKEKQGELTLEEQIEALDDVFYESVDLYESCSQEAIEQANSALESTGGGLNSGDGGSQDGSAGDNDNEGQGEEHDGQSQGQKSAEQGEGVSKEQGFESEIDAEQAGESQGNQQHQGQNQGEENLELPGNGHAPSPEEAQTSNVPEDIPPADNDSVLQRQIREAAMAEKDPEKRKKLWDLYRKYKGEQG